MTSTIVTSADDTSTREAETFMRSTSELTDNVASTIHVVCHSALSVIGKFTTTMISTGG